MYKGKSVLITGASRGIGAMIAEHFKSNEASIICPPRCLMDLSNPSDIQMYFYNKDIKIDILINNAAVLTSQYALKMKSDDAESMVAVNLLGSFIVAREAAKKMNEGGRIVNISSMAVALEPMGDSMYAACKAGLSKMSNIMAKEFAFLGITVNTLAISAIETDMLRQLNKEKVDAVIKSLPLPRYATKEDITNVIDFYCSQKSDYITAQTIYLGGVHA